MKVLFVGEGKHDIGPPASGFGPRPAGGVVPVLARKVCPGVIDEACQALAWAELQRFGPTRKRMDFAAKVAAAILVSARRFGCAGLVCVRDQDRQEDRLAELRKASEEGLRKLGSAHPVVCGVAVESVEAWTLGAAQALAAELELDLDVVRKQYPKADVESLHENSGKAEHRPKALLERLAQLKHRADTTAFREAVAERTDVAILMNACPKGFKPFAEELLAVFGSERSDNHGAAG
jgi:hypothetical protein